MRKSVISLALAGASALMLASCAMPADDPNYQANNGLSGDPSAAASAQASIDAAMAAPTSIGVDAPLPKPAAKGATIVSVLANTDQDALLGASMDEAAKALGWTHKTVVVDLKDPAKAATELDKVIASKPAGIHISGAYVDNVADALTKADKAGIPIVCTGCTGDPAGAIKDTSINGDADNAAWAGLLANYVVKNQNPGEASAVQVFALPGGAMSSFNASFDSALTNACHECSSTQSVIDPTTLDITDAAAFGQFAVGELSTSLGGWMLLDSGSLSKDVATKVAQDPTLLTPQVLLGRGAAADDITSLKSLGGGAAAPAASAGASAPASSPASAAPAASAGASAAASGAADSGTAGRTAEQAAALQAWVGISVPIEGWRVIDQFARILGGGAPATGALTSQFLTGANAADAVVDAKGNYLGITDYQAQFKKLWGVK